jgi:hypothetical protein
VPGFFAVAVGEPQSPTGVRWRHARVRGKVTKTVRGSARASTLGQKAASATAGLMLLVVGFAPSAEARMSCTYTGAPTNVLAVTATGESLGQITRRGQEIVVSEFLERPRACLGVTPTVLNTDTIRVRFRGSVASIDVRLADGPFAPGATPEAEGAPEIEIEFSGSVVFGTAIGSARADEFHWVSAGAHGGLNLNPGVASDQDVDVSVRGRPLALLVADGAAGNDIIVSAPDTAAREGLVFSQGGSGDDLLTAPRTGGNLEGEKGADILDGGRSHDILEGGHGNDRVEAGRGNDRIVGGRGRDLLLGGPGRDSINARDSTRDRVRCGGGRDRVTADRGDRLRGCEVIRRG